MTNTAPVILGCGVDAVEVRRFDHWHTYSEKKLSRLFSPREISYCIAIPAKSAERFAARFAAKEALFKALAPIFPISFLKLCRTVWVEVDRAGAPHLIFNQEWKQAHLESYVSLTHTRELAIAQVILVGPNAKISSKSTFLN